MTPAEVVRVATGAIEHARDSCEDVEFSAEDAARTEPDFLVEVVERAIAAGATTINIPDTVGYAVPSHFAAIIENLRAKVRGIDRVVLSVHCHDDLGMAVANSLPALQAGGGPGGGPVHRGGGTGRGRALPGGGRGPGTRPARSSAR